MMADAESDLVLDATRTVETPEGVELRLPVAGPPVRALAWVLDTLIRSALLIAIYIGFAVLGETGIGLMLIATFIIEWFYPVLFEVYNAGVTPGKKALGLKVIHDDGTPIGWSRSLLRNLLRGADFFPMAYAAGLVSMLCTRDFKRLGDLAAGTLVVHIERTAKQNAISSGPVKAPTYDLATETQGALIDFAHRQATLSPSRQQELATIIAPLISRQSSPETTVADTLAVARWAAGHSADQ